jgi:hypothetical protein
MTDMDGFEIRPEDVRALLEVAETVDDMTQAERDAYDRVRRTIDEHERRTLQELEQHMVGVNTPTQDEIAEAPDLSWDDLVAEQTVSLRAEVKDADDAWQADINDRDLEQAYRDKLTELDGNLQERGLERGEDLDQELPWQSLDQSLNRGHHRGR